MIQISVYRLFHQTVCSVQYLIEPLDKPTDEHRRWVGLSYVTGPHLAHNETQQLVDLVTRAIQGGEKAASEQGGWSSID